MAGSIAIESHSRSLSGTSKASQVEKVVRERERERERERGMQILLAHSTQHSLMDHNAGTREFGSLVLETTHFSTYTFLLFLTISGYFPPV